MNVSKSKIINAIVKSTAAIGLVFTLGIATSGSANAGNFGIDLYLGHQSAIHYGGSKYYGSHQRRQQYGHRYNHNKGNRRNKYRKHRRHQDRYSQPRRHVCGPRRAVRKAYRLGLDGPRVHRVRENKVAVVGYQYGYRTKMVFKRYSNCRLIKTVNFSR